MTRSEVGTIIPPAICRCNGHPLHLRARLRAIISRHQENGANPRSFRSVVTFHPLLILLGQSVQTATVRGIRPSAESPWGNNAVLRPSEGSHAHSRPRHPLDAWPWSRSAGGRKSLCSGPPSRKSAAFTG